MTKSTHHSFDVMLAARFGIEAAIIIHHFQHWINHNKASSKNFRDGRTWSYQTRKSIAAWFPYLSPHQVRRITDKLVKTGVLIKGNYNKKGNDDTIWYAFVDEEKYTTSAEENPVGKSANPNGNRVDESANQAGKSATPLPDTKTDTKPKKKNIAQSAIAASQSADFSYSRESGKFEGITQEDLSDWKEAYPYIDIGKEMIKAAQWLKSNPSRANKRLWRKFVVGWLSRSNDKEENKAAYQSMGNQARRPSQLNNENEGKDKSSVPKSRILVSNNSGGSR